jgi:DNA-binding transcriptional regulator LsrR (DeoR family)
MTHIDPTRTRRDSGVPWEAALAAHRYYVDGVMKNDIATELGVSRFKVSRLIDEARERGLVHISVTLPQQMDLDLASQLSATFPLTRAIIVKADDRIPTATHALLQQTTARYLESRLQATDVLGVSWGRSVAHVVEELRTLPPLGVVQLVGGFRSRPGMVSGSEIVRAVAEKTQGSALELNAPLVVQTADIATQLKKETQLVEVFDTYKRVTVALVGIGQFGPGGSTLFDELPEADQRRLTDLGVVADICGKPCTTDGTLLGDDIVERTIGIDTERFLAIGEVVAPAWGREKADAIAAVLRSGTVTTLITDSLTAVAIVDNHHKA